MDFKEVLQKRASVRKFKAAEISDKIVREILELAQMSPSAGNLQSYKVYIVKSDEEKTKLKEATMSKQESLVSAPVVFVICADKEESGSKYGERGRDFYSIQDATIFAAYIQLAITSLEFSSVWVGAFSEEEVRKIFSIPQNLQPVAIIPFGYADGEPKPRERKKLNDILVS